MPIVGIGRDGKAHDIAKPPGHTVRLKSGGKVRVRNSYFSRPNVVVKRGVRFRKRGKYRIFCALHPVSMTEVVTVR